MKASLLARAAPALLLAGVLAGGPALAQTAGSSAGSGTNGGGSAAPAMAGASGATAAPSDTSAGAAPGETTTGGAATGGAATTSGGTTNGGAAMESHPRMAAPSTAGGSAASGSAAHATTMPRTGSATGAAGQAKNMMHRSVEQRITDLHTRLHITSAQSKPWNAFAQVMRSNARSMDAAYQERAQHIASQNALQDLESYATLERARAQDVERLVPAFRTLYEALSPQQKKDADQLFRSYSERHQGKHR